jgi:organic hydroperoxide reductase OsmC/OhrA
MIEHKASIHWRFDGGDFRKGRYSRAHRWDFDGGLSVAASPSPHVVPAPYSDAGAVDPEEAFVAAVASCHMMTFLFLASRAGHVVLEYTDDAVGHMEKNAQGRYWVSEVLLRPRITWDETPGVPDASALERLHHAAHEECFIANSVKTTIRVLPPVD